MFENHQHEPENQNQAASVCSSYHENVIIPSGGGPTRIRIWESWWSSLNLVLAAESVFVRSGLEV